MSGRAGAGRLRGRPARGAALRGCGRAAVWPRAGQAGPRQVRRAGPFVLTLKTQRQQQQHFHPGGEGLFIPPRGGRLLLLPGSFLGLPPSEGNSGEAGARGGSAGARGRRREVKVPCGVSPPFPPVSVSGLAVSPPTPARSLSPPSWAGGGRAAGKRTEKSRRSRAGRGDAGGKSLSLPRREL